CTLLGTHAHRPRTSPQAARAGSGAALPQEQGGQERSQRCAGDPHRCTTARDALRVDKECRAAVILACHRMREGWRSERTALINRVRGLLAEFGLWIRGSPHDLARSLARLIQDEQLPGRVRALLCQAQEHLLRLEALTEQCELDICE